MPKAPRTEKAIEAATFALAPKEERRHHLGASVIGDKCGREIWYKFRWAFPGQPHKAQLLRLFGRGHREEVEIIKLLREAGVTVYAAGESGELKDSLRISDVDGHFGGTPDAVGVGVPDCPPELPVLLEFKTYNDKRFQELKADGVMTSAWEYFIQMQIYMEKHKLTCALFIAANKNDDELYFEIVHANAPQAQQYIDRARLLIYAEEPPPRIADSIARFPCKFCDFKHICHTEDFPAVNCRTCCHATPTTDGKWSCARGNAGIADQSGCSEHIYDPRWFDGWTVVDGDFDANWIKIDNGRVKFKLGTGPDCEKSADLLKDGLLPF